MTMRLASYTGTRGGLAGLFNRAVRWWLHGPYSHSELVFSDGMSASCSFLDKGPRMKKIEFDPAKWSVVDILGFDEKTIRCRVERSLTAQKKHQFRYSVLLLACFVIPALRRWLSPRDQVCSTWIAWALGIPSYLQLDPMELHDRVCEQHMTAEKS